MICHDFDHFVDLFLNSEEAGAKRSLIKMLCDPDNGALLVDKTIALHKLNADWPGVANRIGAPPTLPRVNVSRVAGLSAISEDARARIRTYYREDIERFGL